MSSSVLNKVRFSPYFKILKALGLGLPSKSNRNAADPRSCATILVVAGCFLASFVYQTISMHAAIGLYDEGIIVFDARRVLDGDLIHRDFYSNYGPGQFYILAGLFKLFSPSILVERLWDSFIRSFLVAVVFLIVARSTRSKWAGLGTAATCMVWLGYFGFYGYPVFPALAAALTALLFLLAAFERPQPTWSSLMAGICVGVAFLFRYDIGGFTALVMAALLGLHAAVQPLPAGRKVSIAMCVGPFAAGFALVALPVIGVFIVYGAMADLVFDIVTYPSKYYYSTRSLPFPGLRQLAVDYAPGTVYLPPFLVAAVFLTLVSGRRNRKQREEGSTGTLLLWAQIALIALTLIYFGKGAVRVSPIHMSMAIVTALVLAGISITTLDLQRGVARVGLVAALGATMGITLGLFLTNLPDAGGNFRALFADAAVPHDVSASSVQASCHSTTGIQRLACFSVDQDHLRVLEFLRTHTRPGEYIYVGLGRHDKVLINDVALYFLSNLRSATKWHQFDPGLQTSAAIQREMIDEISRNHPKYIVLESQWDGAAEPNSSAQSSGVTLLDDYIRHGFLLVKKFGPISVLE